MSTPPCTDAELLEAMTAIGQHGSIRKAHEAINIPRSTLRDRLKLAAERFGKQDATLRQDGRGKPILRVQARRGEIGGPPIP